MWSKKKITLTKREDDLNSAHVEKDKILTILMVNKIYH